jgi:hypothetical protein
VVKEIADYRQFLLGSDGEPCPDQIGAIQAGPGQTPGCGKTQLLACLDEDECRTGTSWIIPARGTNIIGHRVLRDVFIRNPSEMNLAYHPSRSIPALDRNQL